jgi:hypothetical protein
MEYKEGRQVIWQQTPINIIFFFHLSRTENGKDDSSPEAHLQSSKTSGGSYLDLELFIFVKKL